MKYYLLFIMNTEDGKEDRAVYAYGTEDEAVTYFHKQLGGWRAKEDVISILAMVIGAEGNIVRSERYEKGE